jgi:uncharacterized radical SAM superfamily Fe-S cluster-containing enzyme
MDRIIRKTKSVCPVCLGVVDADIAERDGCVYMNKTCPAHGSFSALIWEDTAKAYLDWIGNDETAPEEGESAAAAPVTNGCPYDCGPCTAHAGQFVSVALMTSNRCNLDCPVCFTRMSKQGDYYPSAGELCTQIDNAAKILRAPYPLELCGGEPTVRDDLPQIITHAKSKGFSHIQLNTNGLRIAAEAGYAKSLKEMGVSVAYLGFEGTDEGTYIKKYGRSLLDEKLRAVKNCAAAGLPVVFASIVMPDLNGGGIMSIVETAREFSPTVRGINFQPISYFGTYEPGERVTIPRVIRALTASGEMKPEDFGPVRCQHPLCSFQGAFMLEKNGRLKSLGKSGRPVSAKSAREHTSAAWSESRLPVLTIGGMAFMDAWNMDLSRVRRCRVGIISPSRGIVPLCSQYLTAENGEKIYEGIC